MLLGLSAGEDQRRCNIICLIYGLYFYGEDGWSGNRSTATSRPLFMLLTDEQSPNPNRNRNPNPT